MLHHLLQVWFQWLQDWGYLGIIFLMALESSIVPVPSEIVMPPAAFWAAQGKMDFTLVVLSGTLGSYLGSIISYAVARLAGRPAVLRFGKYVLMAPEKVEFAENWIKQYGANGVFIARFLPVNRHLISIPAGVFRMNVRRFSIATTLGAAIWCWVLSWFGREVIGGHPELLDSPESLMIVMKEKLSWFVVAIVLLVALYAFVVFRQRRQHARAKVRASG
jgi:membrane protein DedA with SNARE-associated domain